MKWTWAATSTLVGACFLLTVVGAEGTHGFGDHSGDHLRGEHERLVQSAVERCFNSRNLDLVDEIYGDRYFYHGDTSGLRGPELRRKILRLWLTAFPDLVKQIEEMESDGDTVTIRARAVGTHLGKLIDLPATGRKIDIRVTSRVRIAEGQIVEEWEIVDLATMMNQLDIDAIELE